MQKRHFKMIAAELRDLLESTETLEERAVAIRAIKRMAAVGTAFNDYFKRDVFYRACGLEVLE